MGAQWLSKEASIEHIESEQTIFSSSRKYHRNLAVCFALKMLNALHVSVYFCQFSSRLLFFLATLVFFPLLLMSTRGMNQD